MNLYKELGVIDYINRSFRDIADQDYIASRIHYRYHLGHQFFWSALQALEKYLKAILLYNHRPATKLGHNIVEAFERVRSIPDIPFTFPSRMDEFLRHLNEEGPNRYFEYTAAATGEELLHLDRTVWYVRRYCQYLRGFLPSKHGQIDRFPIEVARIQQQSEDKAHKVRIWGGFLEQVLDRGPEELRAHLSWKNFYYGRRRKKVIKEYTLHSWSANPTTALRPEIYRELKDLVDFSQATRDYLDQRLKLKP
jgi:hypothetical protein